MRRLDWLGLLVAVLLVLTGCTPSGTPPSPTPTVPSPAVPWDINERDPSGLRNGGLLRMPVAAVPSDWNPWTGDPGAAAVLAPARGAWFLLDAAGRPTPNPDFVASAVADHGSGKTVVTLRTNPRAVWGDGAPVTAADWIATWRALSGVDPRFASPKPAGWDTVGDVRRGADDGEVVVSFTGMVPDWTRPLAEGPARAASVADPKVFSDGWTQPRADWFAGPFVVEAVDTTQGVVTLTRNPRWWGAAPRLDSIVFRAPPPEAMRAAVRNGEFDLVDADTTAGVVANGGSVPDLTVRTSLGARGRLLQFATASDRRLGQADLRRAVVQAVDRTTLTGRSPQTARPEPTGPVVWSNHLLLTNQPGYTDEAESTGLVFDTAAAASTLDAAGWRLDRQGRRAKGGETLTLTIAGTTPTSETNALVSMLGSVGISVRRVAKDADLTPLTRAFSPYPLAEAASVPATGRLKELLTSAATGTDEARRFDEAAQAGRLLWQQAESLPLYQPPQQVLVRPGLANVGAFGLGTPAWERVGWAG